MNLNDLKEAFSHAYVRAIAHAAGFFVQETNRHLDADGVDAILFARSPSGSVRGPRLELQLKATADPVSTDPFPFDLPVKNYEELRNDSAMPPRILVVVVVPADIASWVSANEQELVMRHCGYWHSLRGMPATNNTTTVRIQIPRSSRFHVADVQALMQAIQRGDAL